MNFSSTEGKPYKIVDRTCVFNKNELPFLSKESFIMYREAKILDRNQVSLLINGNVQSIKNTIDSISLRKIQDGVLKSKFTPLNIKKALEEYLACP